MKCLFLVNGLGLGNSTRCHAVIKNLIEAGCRIHVLTSGNGLSYFQNRPGIDSLTEMESFFYSGSQNGISGWSTIRSIGTLARRAKSKRDTLVKLLDRLKPDLAVIDSEYAVSPLRRRRIPIVAINNSEVVVTEYLKHRKRPSGVSSHFWFVEFFDYLFHRHFADLVLSPFPRRTPVRHPRFRRIGLIVRPEVRQLAGEPARGPAISPREIRRVVFMLSGSIHSSRVDFAGRQFPFRIDVVGRTGESTSQVTFHGRQMNNLDLLAQADAYVINGGYSAVSEIFALRKPAFVLPVPGHAEQFVNANLVAEMGLGFVATESDVLDRLLNMYQQDQWIGLRHPALSGFAIEGDREGAAAILACAAERGIQSALPRSASTGSSPAVSQNPTDEPNVGSNLRHKNGKLIRH